MDSDRYLIIITIREAKNTDSRIYASPKFLDGILKLIYSSKTLAWSNASTTLF